MEGFCPLRHEDQTANVNKYLGLFATHSFTNSTSNHSEVVVVLMAFNAACRQLHIMIGQCFPSQQQLPDYLLASAEIQLEPQIRLDRGHRMIEQELTLTISKHLQNRSNPFLSGQGLGDHPYKDVSNFFGKLKKCQGQLQCQNPVRMHVVKAPWLLEFV